MEIKISFYNSKNLIDIVTRRINIDIDSFNYNNFLSYLKSLFDIDDSEIIYLQSNPKKSWLQSESDWKIFIESNSNTNDSIIKLNMYCGNLHTGVECDICDKNVIGDRYKCLQCDDYDICQLCFQNQPDIHKEHCFLLLRTASDSLKFLKSIPIALDNGQADFRVIDIDLNDIIQQKNIRSSISTQTDIINSSEPEISNVKTDSLPKLNGRLTDFLDSSVSDEYINSLPDFIHKALATLEAMGFKNLKRPIIDLIVKHNGDINNVIDELPSMKK